VGLLGLNIGWIQSRVLLYVPCTSEEIEADDQAVFTTQMLPGRCPPIANAKKTIEKAIYEIIG
jgi:hypothetical protein